MKNSYRGWTIKYEKFPTLGDGINHEKFHYIAYKDGAAELAADSRVGIERKIDAFILNKTPAKKS